MNSSATAAAAAAAAHDEHSAWKRIRRASVAFASAVDGLVFGATAKEQGPRREEKDTYVSTTALIGIDAETGAPRFYGDVSEGEIAKEDDVPQRTSDEHGRPVGPTRPVALPLLIPRFARQGRGKVGAAARKRELHAFREAPEFQISCRRLELFLGIEVGDEPRYRDIVEEAMVAPLPPGATCFVNMRGDTAFYKVGRESGWGKLPAPRSLSLSLSRSLALALSLSLYRSVALLLYRSLKRPLARRPFRLTREQSQLGCM